MGTIPRILGEKIVLNLHIPDNKSTVMNSTFVSWNNYQWKQIHTSTNMKCNTYSDWSPLNQFQWRESSKAPILMSMNDFLSLTSNYSWIFLNKCMELIFHQHNPAYISFTLFPQIMKNIIMELSIKKIHDHK